MMKKRIVSAFLAVLMVCSMFGSTALAAGESARYNYTVCPRCDKGMLNVTTKSEMTGGPILMQCPRDRYHNCERREYTVYTCYSCNSCPYSECAPNGRVEYRWTHIGH